MTGRAKARKEKARQGKCKAVDREVATCQSSRVLSDILSRFKWLQLQACIAQL